MAWFDRRFRIVTHTRTRIRLALATFLGLVLVGVADIFKTLFVGVLACTWIKVDTGLRLQSVTWAGLWIKALLQGTADTSRAVCSNTLWPYSIIGLLLAFLAAAWLVLQLRKLANRIKSRRVLSIDPSGYRCRVLITGLSPTNPAAALSFAELFKDHPDLFARYLNDRRRDLTQARINEIDLATSTESGAHWLKEWPKLRALAMSNSPGANAGPWQQNFRACFAERHSLKKVMVLPSHESHLMFDDFKKFIGVLIPGVDVCRVTTQMQPFQSPHHPPDTHESRNYEDYDYVSEGIEIAIASARVEFPGIRDHEICIDITPGLKPYSIAGAVKTLNEDVMMLYVTNAGEIKIYDAVVQLEASGQENSVLG
jgi:hypothetical protein